MGPSGSGKTSLLSILGGRAPSSVTVDGDIKFNGKRPGKNTKRSIGFVLQDDLLYPELTVRETLYFAAQLRLPKDMSKEQKMARLGNIITALGLDRCTDTIIGGFIAGQMKRGVSGGERKRVSVGHELLIDPSIIFLDEPTSGLDSTNALSLMNTLGDLAAGGRTVVTSIHQPSSKIFQKLQKLMLLSEGRVLYYGFNSNCVEWFNALQAPCPFGMNVADFILDLANANQGASKDEGARLRALQVNAFERLTKDEMYDSEAGVSAELLSLAPQLLQDARSGGEDSAMHTGTGKLCPTQSKMTGLFSSLSSMASLSRPDEKQSAPASKWPSSWMLQFVTLFIRAVKVRRFETWSTQTLVQMVGVGVIGGLFYFQAGQNDTVESARDVAGLLFFECLFMTLNSAFTSLFVFPKERGMVLKERASGMYRLSAYYFARTLSDIPMECFYPSIFVVIVYFLGGLRLTAKAFFANWLSLLLSLLTSQSTGLAIGAGVANQKSGQTLAGIVLLTLMLSGGFFVSYVPVWLSWVRYISYISYSYNVLLHIEFSERTIVACENSTSTDCPPVENLQRSLGLLKDPNESIALDIGILFLLMFVLRFFVYVILNRSTKQS